MMDTTLTEAHSDTHSRSQTSVSDTHTHSQLEVGSSETQKHGGQLTEVCSILCEGA